MPSQRPPIKKQKGIKPVTSPKKNETALEMPANGDLDQSGASVDKIRDILFGPQIKNYESRFARVEDLTTEPTSLDEVVARMVDFLSPTARQQKIEINWYTASDLPPVNLEAVGAIASRVARARCASGASG